MKMLKKLLLFFLCLPLFSNTNPNNGPEKISRLGEYQGYTEAKYKGTDYSSLYISMPDDVKLAVDVHLPKGLEEGAKIPTLVYFVRYCRSIQLKKFFRFIANPVLEHVSDEEVDFFTSYGYACVVVDLRGSGASFGHRSMEFSPEEVKDMSKVFDWIVEQPWSDGQTATTGISYTGTTAELALSSCHPSLKASIPRCNIFDLYTDMTLPGGIRQAPFVDVWKTTTQNLDHNQFDVFGKKAKSFVKGVNPVDEDKKGKMLQAAVKEHEKNFDIFAGLMRIDARDDVDSVLGLSCDAYSIHNRIPSIEKSNVPIYRITGWYDGANVGGIVKGYWNIKNTKRVLIGPWDHGPDQMISPFANSDKVEFNVYAEMLRFFDFYMKGIDNGIDKEDPFHFYQMGNEQFVSTAEWPLKAEVIQKQFLTADKSLASAATDGKTAFSEYECDYELGTGGGSRWNSLTGLYRYAPIGYPGRREAAQRMLVFDGAPLAAPLDITGHPVADLYIAAPAKDAQVFVYLEDVAPDGSVTYITEGMFRAAHRKIKTDGPLKVAGPYHSFKREDMQDLTPNEVTRLQFDLQPISYQVPKGHRLRVSLATADLDHFEKARIQPETLKVYHNEKFPSNIQVPVIE